MKLSAASISKISVHWIVKTSIIVLTLIFVYAWSVQFNDPDPIFWCTLYGGAVFVSVLDWMKLVRNKILFGIMGGCYTLIFLFWTFRFWPWNVEEQREAGGLFLLILWGGLNYWKRRDSSLMIQTG